jgi:hypothetical protein
MKLTVHLCLVPRSKMGCDLPPCDLYAFMLCSGTTLPYVKQNCSFWEFDVFNLKFFLGEGFSRSWI